MKSENYCRVRDERSRSTQRSWRLARGHSEDLEGERGLPRPQLGTVTTRDISLGYVLVWESEECFWLEMKAEHVHPFLFIRLSLHFSRSEFLLQPPGRWLHY